MADKILSKADLASFTSSLQEGRDVFAPALEPGTGHVVWSRLEKAGDILWEFSNTRMSPKDFFFPQTECMMRFKNRKDDPEGMLMRAEPDLPRERVLLNIRPCDAKAFEVLDTIFVQDEMTNDLYWRDKRDKTILVGLACSDPCPTCFCTSVGAAPHGTTGLDLLLVDLGDRFLVKALTEKGQALAKNLPEAGEGDAARAGELARDAEARVSSKVDTGNLASRTVMELYEAPHWDRVAESCLNCGTCTYSCPTCHCFDIQDEVQGPEGRRVRNWDTCMSWLFTMHGTGHNPRGTKKDRVRQRFMHKFKYIPEKREGRIGCVGCGRCIQLCPVNIDVREVVRHMND